MQLVPSRPQPRACPSCGHQNAWWPGQRTLTCERCGQSWGVHRTAEEIVRSPTEMPMHKLPGEIGPGDDCPGCYKPQALIELNGVLICSNCEWGRET